MNNQLYDKAGNENRVRDALAEASRLELSGKSGDELIEIAIDLAEQQAGSVEDAEAIFDRLQAGGKS